MADDPGSERQGFVILITATLIIGVAAICICVYMVLTIPPYTSALRQTKQLMQELETPIPENAPSYWLDADCLQFLEDSKLRNKNTYSVDVVNVFGDYGTPIPGGTGAIIVITRIVFADGAEA